MISSTDKLIQVEYMMFAYYMQKLYSCAKDGQHRKKYRYKSDQFNIFVQVENMMFTSY